MSRSRKNQITNPETVKLAEEPIDERTPIQKYLAEIGRKGGLKGGIARKQALSKKRRKEIAMKAAKARWGS